MLQTGIWLFRPWDSLRNLVWGPLRTDGVHVSEKAKSIFGYRLVKLVKRALRLLGERNASP